MDNTTEQGGIIVPEHIAKQLQEWQDAGITGVCFSWSSPAPPDDGRVYITSASPPSGTPVKITKLYKDGSYATS